MKQIVLASNNQGKIKEFREILKDFEIVTMKEIGFFEEIEENGNSFYENALIKAKTVSEKLNLDVIADDSGLMVDALNGDPGIFSARYSGIHGNDEQNRKLLLKNLSNVTDFSERTAHFHCSIVLYKTNKEIVCGNGDTFGRILFNEQGNNGFGYDSLFFSDDLKKSFGEASNEEKNSISHRKRALIDLKRNLK